MLGSLSEVSYWKDTPPIELRLKPFGRPASTKSTA
jgi:hypothetical protein